MLPSIPIAGSSAQGASSGESSRVSSDFPLKLPALRAVLTRPADRQMALAQRLHAQGWDVLSLPALELVATGDSTLNVQFRPEQFDWIMFVSRTAWRLYRASTGVCWPASTRIAVVGQGTAQAIAEDFAAGLLRPGSGEDVSQPSCQTPEILTPEKNDSQDSEGLWRRLEPRLSDCSRVLIVAGRQGRTWLRDKIRAYGAQCEVMECYQRIVAPVSAKAEWTLRQWSRTNELASGGVWLFTSQHGVQASTQALKMAGLLHLVYPAAVLVTHERLVQPAVQWLGHTRAPENTPVWICQPDDDSLEQGFEQIRLQSVS